MTAYTYIDGVAAGILQERARLIARLESEEMKTVVMQAICCPEGCGRDDDCWAANRKFNPKSEETARAPAIKAGLEGE